MKLSQKTALITLTFLAVLAPCSATAQGTYPSKPIRVVVPFAAGSTTDIIARAISDKMSQSMGQPLVIDNRLHDEVVKALATAEVKERFVTLGADAWTMRPDQFEVYISEEIKSNTVLVKAAGLSPAT